MEIRRLHPNELVRLIDSEPKDGYLKVKTQLRETGYLWANFLDILPPYERRDWMHWLDEDGDCQNARHEVLIRQSRTEVTFKTDKQCQVITGEWLCPYTGQIITQASELHIDHVVPMAHAHRMGGWEWSDRLRSPLEAN
jgi:hypothetical protein